MISKVWIAMFSKTGSELREVCKRLGRYPDRVLSTNVDAFTSFERYINVIENPTVKDYRKIAGDPEECIITLHGFMKIIPNEICKDYTVYNGHPGDIVKYPQLKGKDPQQKAIDLKLETSGCVVHKVTSEVDSGEIVARVSDIPVTKYNVDVLHKVSIDLWVSFLKGVL